MKGYDIFKAIADKTRREIFRLLSEKDGLTINQISEKFNISRQGVTKHLRMLESSGLVEIKQFGRERKCYPRNNALNDVHNWVGQYVG